jgi:heat shock protein HtpX
MLNWARTVFFLTLLTLLAVAFGQAAGGTGGALTALAFSAVLNISAWWFSDKIVLALYRAQPVSELEAPELYVVLRELTQKQKIPMPRVYVIPSAAPNAFATGRNPSHAAVAVTRGIADLLNRDEMKAVLAHELAHVAHRDTLTASAAATLAGVVSILASAVRWLFLFGSPARRDGKESNPFVLLIMALTVPVIATLIQLAVSRSRELAADDRGAKLCGDPLFLASALRKLAAGSERIPLRPAGPATAHLFIVNPLRPVSPARLFSSHPPLEERVARLEAMARRVKGLTDAASGG